MWHGTTQLLDGTAGEGIVHGSWRTQCFPSRPPPPTHSKHTHMSLVLKGISTHLPLPETRPV
jgi:hypothetical protein